MEEGEQHEGGQHENGQDSEPIEFLERNQRPEIREGGLKGAPGPGDFANGLELPRLQPPTQTAAYSALTSSLPFLLRID
jgi:hypothetical protein